jgi:hypothetical protein
LIRFGIHEFVEQAASGNSCDISQHWIALWPDWTSASGEVRFKLNCQGEEDGWMIFRHEAVA